MNNLRIIEGDTVRVGGFAPMSSMEHYEGSVGVVIEIEPNTLKQGSLYFAGPLPPGLYPLQ